MPKRAFYAFTLAVLLVNSARAASAASRVSIAADGSIAQQSEYAVPRFEESGFPQRPDIKEYYEKTVVPLAVEMEKDTFVTDIHYYSDGLLIRGFSLTPRNIGVGEMLPIIVFNHGGNREFGKLTVKDLLWLNNFAKKGYVVVASQYRGVDGGEGSDEFGGRDVDDVKNVAVLAKNLPHASPLKTYMIGHSRGGMMTYLALKDSHAVLAAAVLAGECDLEKGLEARPDFERQVYAQLIPNYWNDKAAQLRSRSACSWPEKINAPVYIMQGDQDRSVEPIQASMMSDKLEAQGRKVKLEILPGGDHSVFFKDAHAAEVVEKIDRWFQSIGQANESLVPPAR